MTVNSVPVALAEAIREALAELEAEGDVPLPHERDAQQLLAVAPKKPKKPKTAKKNGGDDDRGVHIPFDIEAIRAKIKKTLSVKAKLP